ncbi:LysR family transcriptional regulator [Pseudoalteromonas distincta]|jgi:DNA-binding transcriptional LysR family regulator|uniref:HTH lysR-type domain-containing protein n=1 Tax=marine sediment metagenome TaxID=412755 RepID=A0A0F9KGC1_9ZZZZ|nr:MULTISPECIES: LysR family transcriptional regulator [Pseudoalteromonas]MBB1338407.1 LysR family transcriptional regulator [Pseudoalteromonas sp. SR44-2]MDC3212470.1 LysR family transcriptional regulator [Pseudoalteromonas distincta]MDN3384777.1 LysR family transcriptional regulator [Pseudoalteromonas sp. APC 3358]
MNSGSLRIFCTVADYESVTQAAIQLRRAPSNVTTKIKQLESDLGVELFIRTGKKMKLASSGRKFYEYAQQLLALENEARQAIMGESIGGQLIIGSMESTAASRLPSVLSEYNIAYPTTNISLTTGTSMQLLEKVSNGELDCAFLALPDVFDNDKALVELGINTQEVWSEELLLLVPISEKKTSNFKDIKVRNLVSFHKGCTYREIAENILNVNSSIDWKIHEMSSYHAMAAYVASGMSVTVLPKSVLDLMDLPASISYLRIKESKTLIIWRKEFDVPAFKNFLKLLTKR